LFKSLPDEQVEAISAVALKDGASIDAPGV
jgi:hypothetical protein